MIADVNDEYEKEASFRRKLISMNENVNIMLSYLTYLRIQVFYNFYGIHCYQEFLLMSFLLNDEFKLLMNDKTKRQSELIQRNNRKIIADAVVESQLVYGRLHELNQRKTRDEFVYFFF